MKHDKDYSIYGAVAEILKMIREMPHVRRFCWGLIGLGVLYIVAPVVVALCK